MGRRPVTSASRTTALREQASADAATTRTATTAGRAPSAKEVPDLAGKDAPDRDPTGKDAPDLAGTERPTGLDPVRPTRPPAPADTDERVGFDPDELDLVAPAADLAEAPTHPDLQAPPPPNTDPDLAQWQHLTDEVAEEHAAVEEAEVDLDRTLQELAERSRTLHLLEVGGAEPDSIATARQAYLDARAQAEYARHRLDDAREELAEAEQELRAFEDDHAELVVEQTGESPEERSLADELEDLRAEVQALQLQTELSPASDWQERVQHRQTQLGQAHAEAVAALTQAQTDAGDAQARINQILADAADEAGNNAVEYDPFALVAGGVGAALEGELDAYGQDFLAQLQEDLNLPADTLVELQLAINDLNAAVSQQAVAQLAVADTAARLDDLAGIASVRIEEEQELAQLLHEAEDALRRFEDDHEDFVEAYDAARETPADEATEITVAHEDAAAALDAAEQARINALSEVQEAQDHLLQLQADGAPPDQILQAEVALEVAVSRLDRFDDAFDDAERDARHAEDDFDELQEELAALADGPGDDGLGELPDPTDQLDQLTGPGDLAEVVTPDEATTPAPLELDEAVMPGDAAVLPGGAVLDPGFGVGDAPAPAVAAPPPVAAELVEVDLAATADAATPAGPGAIGGVGAVAPPPADLAATELAQAELVPTELAAPELAPLDHDGPAGLGRTSLAAELERDDAPDLLDDHDPFGPDGP